METEICVADLADCNRDGWWTAWSNWTGCWERCPILDSTRSRECVGQLGNGSFCNGTAAESVSCDGEVNITCYQDGWWGEWTAWSSCPDTCPVMDRNRSRDCVGQIGNGSFCIGDSVQLESCLDYVNVTCDQDGWWGEWLPWSACDVTCGNGTQIRTRVCVGQMGAGSDCAGVDSDVRSCIGSLSGSCEWWGTWSSWSSCDVICGLGNRTRTRECTHAGGVAVDASLCPGESADLQVCLGAVHTGCDADGFWANWASWSICSVTCQGGSRIRERDCVGQSGNGSYCTGPRSETLRCGAGSCQGGMTSATHFNECSKFPNFRVCGIQKTSTTFPLNFLISASFYSQHMKIVVFCWFFNFYH